MKRTTLILLIACLPLLPSCGTVSKVDSIATEVLRIKDLTTEKLAVLEAKAAAKDAELVALKSSLEDKLGHEVTQADVAKTVKEIATTPSLWKWAAENWDDLALLLGALGVGLPVGKLAARKGVAKLHQAGRSLVGPSQPPTGDPS